MKGEGSRWGHIPSFGEENDIGGRPCKRRMIESTGLLFTLNGSLEGKAWSSIIALCKGGGCCARLCTMPPSGGAKDDPDWPYVAGPLCKARTAILHNGPPVLILPAPHSSARLHRGPTQLAKTKCPSRRSEKIRRTPSVPVAETRGSSAAMSLAEAALHR